MMVIVVHTAGLVVCVSA